MTTTGAGHPGTHRRPCWNGYWPRMMDDVEVCKDPPCMPAGQGRASEACWIARTFSPTRRLLSVR